MGIRRDRTEVYRDILTVASKPCRKTKLVYGSNLNFKITDEYAKELIEAKMLETDGTFFTTTQKGFDYIRIKNNLTNLFKH